MNTIQQYKNKMDGTSAIADNFKKHGKSFLLTHYRQDHLLEEVIADWDINFNSLAPIDIKIKDIVTVPSKKDFNSSVPRLLKNQQYNSNDSNA